MTGTATALRDAIQQTLDGKLSGPTLMRNFMAHDEWRVPVHLDEEGKSHAVYIKDTDNQRFQLLQSTDFHCQLLHLHDRGQSITAR